ncbi:hypothetical protein Pta02_72260 [Planobispora takensis]|uniref:Uncharacterized protein n=1 Tax=Planobispora takensis TaxID=1367882 RepID=A0A8J3T3V1_9ACTN|nr:hypothetical protein Pta02_72260 [Planobispora takensis]
MAALRTAARGLLDPAPALVTSSLRCGRSSVGSPAPPRGLRAFLGWFTGAPSREAVIVEEGAGRLPAPFRGQALGQEAMIVPEDVRRWPSPV